MVDYCCKNLFCWFQHHKYYLGVISLHFAFQLPEHTTEISRNKTTAYLVFRISTSTDSLCHKNLKANHSERLKGSMKFTF